MRYVVVSGVLLLSALSWGSSPSSAVSWAHCNGGCKPPPPAPKPGPCFSVACTGSPTYQYRHPAGRWLHRHWQRY